MAGAKAVATTFFQGCVFALRTARLFACEATPYRRFKLQGLMRKIGGENYLLGEGTSAAVYDTCLSQPLDSAITQRMEDLRRTSGIFLDCALTLP